MADARLVPAVTALARALARFGVRHMLIGGVAIVARGIRRLTDDVDATFWAESVDVVRLLEQLAKDDIRPRISGVLAFARRSQVLLLRHEPSQVDIDLSLAFLPFEDEALDRASKVRIGRRSVPVATPDDLVVYKAIAARERDRADIARLLEVHGKSMALERVRGLVGELAEALERPELLQDLDTMVRQQRARENRSKRSKKARRRK